MLHRVLTIMMWLQCLGGKSLALICRIICEDYTHRSSGVPDLLLWRMSDSSAKFVEVKGPGDTLMENQKVRCSMRMTFTCRLTS